MGVWTSGLQECKGKFFFEVRRGGRRFSVGFTKNLTFLSGVTEGLHVMGPMPYLNLDPSPKSS